MAHTTGIASNIYPLRKIVYTAHTHLKHIVPPLRYLRSLVYHQYVKLQALELVHVSLAVRVYKLHLRTVKKNKLPVALNVFSILPQLGYKIVNVIRFELGISTPENAYLNARICKSHKRRLSPYRP